MRRLLTCSDIHGHIYPFKILLKTVKYDPNQDILVIIGDAPDRGPNPCDTIRLMRNLVKEGAVYIVGNHDEAFSWYVAGSIPEDIYFNPKMGGRRTVMSYIEKHGTQAILQMENDAEWLMSQPISYELQNYFFCHAGFKINEDRSTQEENMKWGWETVGPDFLYKDIPGRLTVFGHYSAKSLRGDGQFKPWTFKNKVCINTGADLDGGYLSIVEFPSGTVYSTPTIQSDLQVPDPARVYPGTILTYNL